jgi:AP-1 complex subunit gamma-1
VQRSCHRSLKGITLLKKIVSAANAPVYVRKKAILTVSRIIRKVPEMADLFVPSIENLLEDRNNCIK